jgi:hypothetical protein
MIWSSRYIKKTEFEWDNVKIEALVAFYSKADAGELGLADRPRRW